MTRRVGGHHSVAKGLVEAMQAMEEMGGNCLQVFSGSPRVWARKPIDAFPFDTFRKHAKEHDFGPTVTHALYLVNLASDNADLLKKSVGVLKYDMEFDAKLGGGGVIVHLGSHQGRGFDAVLDQLVESLDDILTGTPEGSTFLIENSAGQNGKLCSDLHEIRILFDRLGAHTKSGRLGWCFDTCHAHCAGYGLDTVENAITQEKLWDGLKIIHVNDSRDPFGSGRDRHENVGEGTIGKEKFRAFLNNPKYTHLPLILEVPGFDKTGPDKKNIDIVKSLIR